MKILLIAFFCLANKLNAQCFSKTVSLGNFKTVSGKEIKNCIIGYSAIGKLNANRSNVVLWPTWYTGKSEEICSDIVPLLMDTAGLYIVVADAFGNGISSSPSNNSSFPEITIRDMVNSQYELLTKHLHISHLKILIGASMGGLQVLEWLTSYPDFADNAISIEGSPKLSSYDMVFWQTEAALFSMPTNDGISNELVLRMGADVFLLNKYTPSYWSHKIKQASVDSTILAEQTNLLKKMKKEDCLCQAKAILTQDIYKSSGKTIADIKQETTARILIIVSKRDYIVNPQSSVDFAKATGATLLELDSDCGHIGFLCDRTLVKETIRNFLRQ